MDASVALKWFFQGRTNEDHVDRAVDVLALVAGQRLTMIQPPHFLAEVAAVLAREKPDNAQEDVADLQQVDWRIKDDAAVYGRAVELAAQFKQHLFDTLYHAVALEMPNATLVTADNRYYRRARALGQVELLEEFI